MEVVAVEVMVFVEVVMLVVVVGRGLEEGRTVKIVPRAHSCKLYSYISG